MLHSSLHNSTLSSSQYEALLELISVVQVGGWEYNLQTTELSWTDVTRAIHEVDADFVPDVSTAISFYYGEHIKKSISNAFETLLEKGTSFDLKLQIFTAKGNLKYVRSIGKAGFIDGKITRAYGSFQDITVEAESEKNLEKALNDLQNIMASSLDVICVVNRDGNYVQVNAAVEKIWGYTVEEMLQKNVAEMVFEEDQEKTKEIILRIMNGEEITNFETRYKRKDGSIVDMSWSSIWDRERNLRYSTGRDISQKKMEEAEKNKLINELVQNNKDLKQFSYITSHNLRAPVTNLLALLKLLNWNDIKDEQNIMLLKSFEKSTEQLNSSIAALLEVLVIKEKSANTPEAVSFDQIFNKALLSFTSLLEKLQVTLHVNFFDAPTVVFNKEYLESIFTNLLSNALKYYSPKRKPTIHISTSINGEFIQLIFKDNGIGINLTHYKDKIFKLFQTFHPNKDSKGIGLYLIQSQVTALGGKVAVESEVDCGTSFIISFRR